MLKKHTSAPWIISPDAYHDDELTIVGGVRGETVIATVWPQGDDDDEQCANRLLIAAAPDLLEACRQALRIRDTSFKIDAKNTIDLIEYRKFEQQKCGIEVQIRAAIAKAEGVELPRREEPILEKS